MGVEYPLLIIYVPAYAHKLIDVAQGILALKVILPTS